MMETITLRESYEATTTQRATFLAFLTTPRRGVPAITWAVIALILIGGLAYSIFLGNTLRFPDEQEYVSIAENIVHHHTYSLDGSAYTASRSPGYPFILALLVALHLPLVVARFVNFLALGIAIYLLSRILRDRGFTVASAIAPVLMLLYPVLFCTAGTLYPQTVGLMLVLLTIAVITKSPTSLSRFALGGAIFGLLILVIPSFLEKLPFFALIVTLLVVRRRIAAALIFAVVALLPIVPWTVNNAYHFHAFIPVSTNAGVNLILGNSEFATANGGTNVDISRYVAAAAGLNEVETDQFYRAQAEKWVLDNKPAALRLYLRKTINYFNYRNDLFVAAESSRLKDLIMLLTYMPLLALFLVRILAAKLIPLSNLERCFILLYLMNAFLDAVFFTRIRFRLPFDPLLIGVVAIFCEYLLMYAGHPCSGGDRAPHSADVGS